MASIKHNASLYDPIYGRIDLDQNYTNLVESYYFRRLQHLRQLGLCYFVFPGGNHTRFEHSIGSYYLASSLAPSILKSSTLTPDEQIQLIVMLRLGTLCHDLGHGPFSHMTENVLLGLGAEVSHEEVSAAIILHYLKEHLQPFTEHGVSAQSIANLVTKSSSNVLERCAEEMVSSDLDLDRLDYLHRDSHYSGQSVARFNPQHDLRGVWNIGKRGGALRFELTERGIGYAETILMLRRNNYKNIVYESRHMCLTAMFEKVVYIAANSGGAFAQMCGDLTATRMDWKSEESVKKAFPTIWRLYGMVDNEALALLEENENAEARILARQIRNGEDYHSELRLSWRDLHYVAKQRILGFRKPSDAFVLRRKLEGHLGDTCGIASVHIACHLPRYPRHTLLSLGTEDGAMLEERSALGDFLLRDALNQYAIEIYVNRDVLQNVRAKIVLECKRIFKHGEMSF